jgi:hypothetical protein
MHPNKCSLKTSTLTSGTYRQKLTLSFLLFTLIFYLLSLAEVKATIRYVSKTGLSIPPYTSWKTAADSIQECINICVFGDTIYVANGVYEEQVVMIPGLSLIGAGMDSCVIYLSIIGIPAVQVMDTCLFKGFKILLPNTLNTWGFKADTSGVGSKITLNKVVNASLGIVIRYSNLKVYNNIFENIKTRGIWLFTSNSVIRNNYIYTDQNQISPNGIYTNAIGYNYFPIIDSNYIEVTPGGVGINKNIDSSPTIKNNVIKLKGIGSGAISSNVGGTSKIFNNLIIVEAGYSGIDKTASFVQILNNHIKGHLNYYGIEASQNDIVKNNVVTGANFGIGNYGTQNPIYFQFNNSWRNGLNYGGFTPDTTNLSVNPMIVNDDSTQGNLDFHLQMYSPLIDAGDPTILDKDGSRSDIGLYGGPYGESYIYVDLPPRTPVNLTASVDSNIVTLKWNKNTEADFGYYKIFYDTTKNFQVDSTKLISSQPDTFYYFVIPAGAESLYFKLTSVDNQGNESNPTEEVGVIVTSVKDEWKPVNNYILYQNYPNPFNPSTKIGYKLKERGYVKLYVYDIKGELVTVLVNHTQEAGYYEVEFSTGVGSGQSEVGGHSGEVRNLASGVYIYQIFVSNENRIPVFSDIKKMVYVK